MSDHARLIDDYYAAFSDDTDGLSRLERAVTPDWTNTGSPGDAVSFTEFAARLTQLRQAVPDLSWAVHEVIDAGDRIVVRGEGTGTPVLPFLGVPAPGGSFRILSLDVHALQGGRIAATRHLEDWAGAVAQLRASSQGLSD